MSEIGVLDEYTLSQEGRKDLNDAEKTALGKVQEIDHPGTLVHVMSLDRLDNIFQNGIQSEKFSNRIGKKVKRRWRESDPSKVYVGKIGEGRKDWFGNLEAIANTMSDPQDTNQVAVLILDPKVEKKGSISNTPGERVIRYRISPKYIVGIAVGGSMEAFMDYFPERKRIKSFTADKPLVNKLKDRTLAVMKGIFKGEPEKFLPIYDLKGKVLWPEHREISEAVSKQSEEKI